jgi:hypothetical protein
MLQTATHVLVQKLVTTQSAVMLVTKAAQVRSDFGPFYVCYLTAQKPALYKSAVKLLFSKWKPLFGTGMDTEKPGQILPQHSPL